MMQFWSDESGVLVSAEIVLLCTIVVLGLVVGLVEFQSSIVAELEDLASAFGNFDQSYKTSGFVSIGSGRFVGRAVIARTFGAAYADLPDNCDCDTVHITCNDGGEKNSLVLCNGVGTGGNAAFRGTGFSGGFAR